jgi:hypothetical protein
MKIDFLGVRQTPIFIWIQHGTINLSRPSKKKIEGRVMALDNNIG